MAHRWRSMRWRCVKTGPQLVLRQLIPRFPSRFHTVLRLIVRPWFPITNDAEDSAETYWSRKWRNRICVSCHTDITRGALGLSDKLPVTLPRCTKREMIERDILKRPVTLSWVWPHSNIPKAWAWSSIFSRGITYVKLFQNKIILIWTFLKRNHSGHKDQRVCEPFRPNFRKKNKLMIFLNTILYILIYTYMQCMQIGFDCKRWTYVLSSPFRCSLLWMNEKWIK